MKQVSKRDDFAMSDLRFGTQPIMAGEPFGASWNAEDEIVSANKQEADRDKSY